MHSGVLPERDDDIDRIEAWLDQLLAGRPAHHATLIRPCAAWHLLRRVRSDAHRRPPISNTAARIRSWLRVALELLDWVDTQQLTLAQLAQADLDRRLAEGANNRTVRYFLTWAAERGLAQQHDIACAPQQAPTAVLDDQQRWRQLRRCLTDQQLPAEVRVAGALILLYGLATSRIRCLTAADITAGGERRYLTIGRKPLLLPPSLAGPAAAACRCTPIQLAGPRSTCWRAAVVVPRTHPRPGTERGSVQPLAVPPRHRRQAVVQRRPGRPRRPATHSGARRRPRHPHPHRPTLGQVPPARLEHLPRRASRRTVSGAIRASEPRRSARRPHQPTRRGDEDSLLHGRRVGRPWRYAPVLEAAGVGCGGMWP